MNKIRQAKLPKQAYEDLIKEKFIEDAKRFVRCHGQDRLGQCIRHVNPNQEKYSLKNYGKPLCWVHQREEDEGP